MPAVVKFANQERFPAIRNHNELLLQKTPEELITHLVQVYATWIAADVNLVTRLIGDHCFNQFVGMRLMFTRPITERELRCWFGIPGNVEDDHVDSLGTGLLFTVRGTKQEVYPFVKELVGTRDFVEWGGTATFWL